MDEDGTARLLHAVLGEMAAAKREREENGEAFRAMGAAFEAMRQALLALSSEVSDLSARVSSEPAADGKSPLVEALEAMNAKLDGLAVGVQRIAKRTGA